MEIAGPPRAAASQTTTLAGDPLVDPLGALPVLIPLLVIHLGALETGWSLSS